MSVKDMKGKLQTVTSAQFNQGQPGDNGETQRIVELMNEAGEIVKSIKINPDWKYKVDVVAGTEVPRSRRENANLVNTLYTNGMMGDPNDLDVKEVYFKSIDLPNYRAVIQMLKRKQEEAKQKPPEMPKMELILGNKDMAQAFAEILKGLTGFNQAKRQILKAMGLADKPNDLKDVAIEEVTSRSDVKDVVAMMGTKAADTDPEQTDAKEMAEALHLLQGLKGAQLDKVLEILKQSEETDGELQRVEAAGV
jgi:hypothetical protein